MDLEVSALKYAVYLQICRSLLENIDLILSFK